MAATRVAINGFGRIGRAFYRAAWGDTSLEIVAINDLGDPKNLLYLLKYDSAYGVWEHAAEAKINFLQVKELIALPWKKLGVDIVVESTGFYTKYEDAKGHIDAGAKRAVITAPAHGEGDHGEHPLGATVLMGINEDRLKTCPITSNASCTTNAASPVIQILHEAIGVEKAILSTTHAYTASQRIVDSPNTKDFREGRAGAVNIIPSSTGAAIAVTKAIPELEGKFDGISMRVPVVTGSIADITMVMKRDVTREEINNALEAAAHNERWQGIFTVTDEPIVSTDIIGNPHGAIADLEMTRVVGGNLVKVLSWYDNEAGYTNTLLRHVKEAARA